MKRSDNMKISTKGRYALRIMVDIAQNSKDDYVSIKSISERQSISNKYIEQIVSKLVKSNILITSRGHTGGYKLSRKPSDYKVGEILSAYQDNSKFLVKNMSYNPVCIYVFTVPQHGK